MVALLGDCHRLVSIHPPLGIMIVILCRYAICKPYVHGAAAVPIHNFRQGRFLACGELLKEGKGPSRHWGLMGSFSCDAIEASGRFTSRRIQSWHGFPEHSAVGGKYQWTVKEWGKH